MLYTLHRQVTVQQEKPAWQMLSLIQAMSRRKTATKSTVLIKISIAGMMQLKPVLTPQ